MHEADRASQWSAGRWRSAAQNLGRAEDRRTERGEWRDEPDVYRDGESFELPRLTRAISVDEVYDDILDGTGRSLLR